jgi:hypothetical protein
MMLGVMYCKSPVIVSGSLVVAALNKSKGITVTKPALASAMENPQSCPNSA